MRFRVISWIVVVFSAAGCFTPAEIAYEVGCFYQFAITILLVLAGCEGAGSGPSAKNREYTTFGKPERVTIQGYSDHAMEPFITADGRYLFFNNSNDPSVNTNLHYAERINDITFKYKGEIKGVNTRALEGVPTMDRNGNFYFISTRSYDQTMSTIYRGRFAGGVVTGINLVENLSEKRLNHVNFDVEISPSGDSLYFVDGVFTRPTVPDKADIAIARREGSGFRRWEKSAEVLKNINTDGLEYAVCISPDELELFFTRLRNFGFAIYRSTRKTVAEPFELPERLTAIEGFVEAPTLTADGRSLYYHKKDGDRFVIYRVTRSLAKAPASNNGG